MIQTWRTSWADPFYFFFVQLSASNNSFNGDIRVAQMAALGVSKCWICSLYLDLGDSSSPYGAIHPRYKDQVGYRLSLSSRAIMYGETNLVYQGPNATAFHVISQPPKCSCVYWI